MITKNSIDRMMTMPQIKEIIELRILFRRFFSKKLFIGTNKTERKPARNMGINKLLATINMKIMIMISNKTAKALR
jgi:hypothetical protein